MDAISRVQFRFKHAQSSAVVKHSLFMLIPWILMLTFISLSVFYYLTQAARIRKDKRKEKLEERQKEFLHSLSRRRQADGLKDEQG